MARAKTKPKQRLIATWEQAPVIMDTYYVAALLGFKPNMIRDMAKRGELPAIKPGKRAWRFEKSALMAWAGVKE